MILTATCYSNEEQLCAYEIATVSTPSERAKNIYSESIG